MKGLLDALLGQAIDPVSVLLRLKARKRQDVPVDLEDHIALVDERDHYLLDEQSNYLVEE